MEYTRPPNMSFYNEKIEAHLVSIWRESTKFLSLGGREGMLVLTDKRLCFIQKTKAKSAWWQAIRRRQALNLMKSKSVMIIHDGYDEDNLKTDMENPKNININFDDISKIWCDEKEWGSVLYIEYMHDGAVLKYQYTIAQDWVKYPMKDALKFMHVDWEPFVARIMERGIRLDW